MDSAKRREHIMRELRSAERPLSATKFAKELSVSRQIIVGDVALLRASGEKILATPRGYILERTNGQIEYTVACVHDFENMEKELNIMVDNGCTVINVTVEHPIYGQLTGQLALSSRYDVSQFMEKLRNGEVAPLCQLTGGVHLHALSCPDDDCFERTRTALAEAGLLYE